MDTPLFAASIMAADAARLGEEIAGLEACGVDLLHWDIMDGHFVPNMTFGPHILKALRPLTTRAFDVHLMVENPGQWVDPFIAAGADAITFHVETDTDIPDLVRTIRQRGCKAGLAFNPGTALSVIDQMLFAHIDRILIMTVNPGFGGQPYIDQTAKLRMAADLRRKYQQLDIMVDGGINLHTAPQAITAGATSLVSGSAFFDARDRAAFVAALKQGRV